MRPSALFAILLSLAAAGCRKRDAPMSQDQSVFVLRMRGGDVAGIEGMIRKGFSVNLPISVATSQGTLRMSPLMLAALDGQLAMAKALVAFGADAKARDEHGWTALFFVQGSANEEHGLAVSRFLVDAGVPVDAPDDKGSTPLMYAVAAGNAHQVRFLLSRSADPNRRAKDGDTPLFHAVISGNLEILDSLVQARADVNVRMADGSTPLLALPELELPYLVEQEIAKFLLQHGADPNVADMSDVTPLLNALRKKDHDFAKLLLRYRADPNRGGKKKGLSPLMACVKSHDYEMAKILLSYHADPTATLRSDGPSAYTLAQEQGDTRMLALLGGR